MNFNLDKCHVLHIGNTDPWGNYTMDNVPFTSVHRETDLGVIVSADFKLSNQCSEVVKTANKSVSVIGRFFEFKSEKAILTLHYLLVCPYFE